ncbi:MAG: biotin transporter BioY [Bacteroidota bacterium]
MSRLSLSVNIFLQLGLSVLFISLFAQLQITLNLNETGIPITGQTFAVLLVGALLGRKWGPLAVALYLLVGGLGLPVFAKGASGWAVFGKGSGGYLYGFVLGAFIAGMLADWGWGKSYGKGFLLQLLGTLAIMAFGLAQLTVLYGWSKAVEYGFRPFWIGAIIKIILGTLALKLYCDWMDTNRVDW